MFWFLFIIRSTTDPTKEGIACEFCPEKFALAISYWKHSRTQHLELISSFWPKCTDCQLHFPSEKTLNKHVIGKHFARKPDAKQLKTACDYCQLTFKTFHEYTRHANECHKHVIKDDWYECPTCGYHLQTEASLVDHKGRHGGVSPRHIICDFCSQKFRFLKSFHNHANVAHPEEVKEVWQFCDKCLKHYPATQHTHFKETSIDEISCKFCSVVFENKSDHVFHCNVEHLDAVSAAWFICNTCDEYHPTRGSLKSHRCQDKSRRRKVIKVEADDDGAPKIISVPKKTRVNAKEGLDKRASRKKSNRKRKEHLDAGDPDAVPVKRFARKRKAVVKKDFVKFEDNNFDADDRVISKLG